MRRLVLLLVAALALNACGETPRPATEPRVKLKLTAPGDGRLTRETQVSVLGTVTPADAEVRVGGEVAEVSGGEFTADVELQPGANVIDVTAASPGRRPAADALRVVRDMRVEVPRLVGQERDQAVSALKALGLVAGEQRGGSWIDRLLPGDVRVCAMRPDPGTLLAKGESVTLQTAREC